MSTTNGNGKLPSVAELREQVQRSRLSARLAQAEHERSLWESVGQLSLWGYGDLLNPFGYRRDDWGRTWLPLNQQGPQAHKDGRNEPFIQTDSDLDSMRALAYWLTTKNDLAIGALKTLRNYTVKRGYEWEAKPGKGYEDDGRAAGLARQVQRVIDRDADLNKLPSRERSAFVRAVTSGDAFVRHFRQSDGTTRHRFIRAEQVRDPGDRGPCATFGVETDEDDVECVIAYHATYDGTCYERIPAAEVSHLKRNVDEEIKRGLSDFYSSGEALDGVGKLLGSMRKGATLLSKIAWIEEFANATNDQIRAVSSGVSASNAPRVTNPISGKEEVIQYMPDGKIVRVKDSQKFVSPPLAGNTTNFVAVVQAVLRAAGCRWNAPEYMISGDASNANYSSTLVSGSPFVNAVECEQDDFGAFFLRWRWVAIRNACLAGVIDAPFEEVERLVDVTFTPPQVAVANEAEQAQIDSQDMQAGVLSKKTRRARRGLDNEQEEKNLKEEAAEEPRQPPGGGGQGGAPPPEAPPVQESLGGPLREQYGLVLELL